MKDKLFYFITDRLTDDFYILLEDKINDLKANLRNSDDVINTLLCDSYVDLWDEFNNKVREILEFFLGEDNGSTRTN